MVEAGIHNKKRLLLSLYSFHYLNQLHENFMDGDEKLERSE